MKPARSPAAAAARSSRLPASGDTARKRSSSSGPSAKRGEKTISGREKRDSENSCCEKLKQENIALKKELKEVRDLYSQLVKESSVEKFGERRVNLLKAQVYQLERQVLLLTQSLSGRSSLVADVHQLSDHLTTKLSELADNKQLHCVTMSYKQRDDMLDNVRRLHQAAGQTLKLSSKEELKCSFAYCGRFADTNELSIMDSLSSWQYLNLQQLGQLEGRFSVLYGSLTQLLSSLKTLPVDDSTLPSPFHRAAEHVRKCSDMLNPLCQDLLTLSLLVPGQQRFPTKQLQKEVEPMLKRLPPFAKNKQEGMQVIHTVVQTLTNQCHRKQLQVDGLDEDLRYHHEQLDYMRKVLVSFQKKYGQFVSSLNENIVTPVQEILSIHRMLIKTQGRVEHRGGLQLLLDALEESSPNLQEATSTLKKLYDEREWESLVKQCCKEHQSSECHPRSPSLVTPPSSSSSSAAAAAAATH